MKNLHYFFRERATLSHNDPINFILHKAAMGDFVSLNFHRPTFLINDPKDIQHILIKEPLKFHKSWFPQEFKRFFGQGIFTSEGANHRVQRRLMQPHMRKLSISYFIDKIWQNAEKVSSRWEHNQEINLANELVNMGALTMAKIVFDIDNEEDASKIYSAGIRCHRSLCENNNKRIQLPSFFPSLANLRYNLVNKSMDKATKDLLEKARSSYYKQGKTKESIINILINAKDENGAPLDDSVIVDQLKTFSMVTADPIRTIAWSIYETSKNKEIYNNITKELNTKLNLHKSNRNSFTDLTYLNMVYSETVRKYPHSWILHRRVQESVQLPSGNTLSKGDDVFISPLVMHRNKNYFPEPMEFDPDRFQSKDNRSWPKGAYLPFGMGPRSCLGEPLARLQALITLAYLFQRFEFKYSEDPELETPNFFTIQPKNHIMNVRVLKLNN